MDEKANEEGRKGRETECVTQLSGINGDEMMTLEHQDLTERIIWSHHTVNILIATRRRRAGSIARTPQ
jgi:hypothetical protein